MTAVTSWRLAAAPGDPARENEDFTGALGECAILLDGSGAPGDLPTGCVHGVRWFVRQLGARCLASMAAGEPDVPLDSILAEAIADVVSLHQGTCDLACPGTPSAVLAMARSRGDQMDYLVLGDCTLVAEEETGQIRAVSDDRMQQAAPAEYQAMLALPISTPAKEAARVAFVRAQQPLRNQPGGYPVASTDPRSAYEAVTGSVLGARRAALISDGVSRFRDFGLGSWKELLDILASGGPAALFARVREAEDTDPAGIRWPRAKRHDDVGAVFWESGSPQPVAAAIVVSARGVLAGRRNDGKPPWTFIAGEVEPGESPADAAVREVKEETGLEVIPGPVLGRRVHPQTHRVMIYLVASPPPGAALDLVNGDETELAEVGWLALAEAEKLLPGMYEPVLAYLRRQMGGLPG